MKSTLFVAFMALACPVLAQSETASGGKLLDEIISHPGSYSQVCDVMTAPQEMPYRAYELSDYMGAAFSKSKLAAMKKDREALVSAIRERLLAVDFKRKAVMPKKDPAPEESMDGENVGSDPKALSPLLLQSIIELSATEALPELLVVEDKLVKAISVAKDDAKSTPPVVDGWAVMLEGSYDEKEPEAKRERRINLFQARAAQRDLVIVMSRLMREKRYQPFLNSAIEAAYIKGLKAQVIENKLQKVKEGEPLPAELEGSEVLFDPISKLPHYPYSPVNIPYTRESRDEVRAAAAEWIAAHP